MRVVLAMALAFCGAGCGARSDKPGTPRLAINQNGFAERMHQVTPPSEAESGTDEPRQSGNAGGAEELEEETHDEAGEHPTGSTHPNEPELGASGTRVEFRRSERIAPPAGETVHTPPESVSADRDERTHRFRARENERSKTMSR